MFPGSLGLLTAPLIPKELGNQPFRLELLPHLFTNLDIEGELNSIGSRILNRGHLLIPRFSLERHWYHCAWASFASSDLELNGSRQWPLCVV